MGPLGEREEVRPLSVDFARCATFMYEHKYIDFLLEHYEQLKLPYNFAASLGFLSSPLLLDGEMFLGLDEDGEAVAAFGYIYGTGELDYADRHVIQLQTAYCVERLRCTRLFVRGLQFLLQHVEIFAPEVGEIRFWVGDDRYMSRLAAKFARLHAAHDTAFGLLREYRCSVAELRACVSRFTDEHARLTGGARP